MSNRGLNAGTCLSYTRFNSIRGCTLLSSYRSTNLRKKRNFTRSFCIVEFLFGLNIFEKIVLLTVKDSDAPEMYESISKQISSYLTAPVQIFLLIAAVYVIKKFVNRLGAGENRLNQSEEDESEPTVILEPMKKRDFQLHELKEFDGNRNPRILIAVNTKVFDMTRARHLYGPDGPYGVFAGKDASRGLATFSVDGSVLKDEYDDLSDLNSMQMDSLREWEMQFVEKYEIVGKLLKPGERARNYDQESETEDDESKATTKKNE
eukprot:gene7026-7814_t